jgi:glycosyltransferase involved in cell wall biosynthesis
MMMKTKCDVCAVVISDLAYDARVWKEVRSLSHAGLTVRLIGCAYDIDVTRRRGEDRIDVVEVPLGTRTGRVSLFSRAKTLLRVFGEVLRTPARAYHVHNVHPALAAILASRFRRARLVYDAHELYGEPVDQSLSARATARFTFLLEALMVRRADVVVTTNPSRAEVLSLRHGSREVAVLRNVPSLQREVQPLDPGFPPGVKVLLYQGGIYANSRAFRQTVEALSHLPKDIHFVILGFGREDDIDLVRSWAREFAVADRVHLLPPRPFDVLVRTAAAATLGLVPIRPIRLNHTLGDTNKLHEYLMAGLPVVASDLPEIRQIARQGNPPVGETFDPDDCASIVAAVERILSDEEGLARRRSEALRLAREVYNWEVEQEKLLDLYRRLNGQGVQPPGVRT